MTFYDLSKNHINLVLFLQKMVKSGIVNLEV